MTSVFSWQNSVSLCSTSFYTPRPNLLISPSCLLIFYACIPIFYDEKDTFFLALVWKGLAGLLFNFSFFGNNRLPFPNSMLDTFYPGGGGVAIFWCHIFLPFHTVHEVLTARIMEWFAFPSASGPHFVRTLYCDPSILVLHDKVHNFTEL